MWKYAMALMSVPVVLGCAVVSGAADTAGPGLVLASQAAPLACAIESRASGRMMTLTAVVTASEAVSGTYVLDMAHGDGSNMAENTQSGAFAAAAGETVTLSDLTIGGSSAAVWRAELRLAWPGGETVCRASSRNTL